MESGHQIAFTQGEKLQSEWFDGEDNLCCPVDSND